MTIFYSTRFTLVTVLSIFGFSISGCYSFAPKEATTQACSTENTEFATTNNLENTTRTTELAVNDIKDSLRTLNQMTPAMAEGGDALQMIEEKLTAVESQKDAREISLLQDLAQRKSEAELALREAEKSLMRAQNAKDASDMRYIAYLAQQQAQIAARIAQRKLIESNRDEMVNGQVNFLKELQQLEGDMLSEQLTTEQEKNKQLQAQLDGLQAGNVLILGDVLFETGNANLIPIALQNLKKLATFLGEHPEHNISVIGHTDNVGSTMYNTRLSLERAQSVRTALIKNGIEPERVIAKGLGEKSPIATNDSSIGRQQNRRVEISLIKKQLPNS